MLLFATSPGGTLLLKGSPVAAGAASFPSLALSGVGWSVAIATWLIPLIAY